MLQSTLDRETQIYRVQLVRDSYSLSFSLSSLCMHHSLVRTNPYVASDRPQCAERRDWLYGRCLVRGATITAVSGDLGWGDEKDFQLR
jgi:hypothetical protein